MNATLEQISALKFPQSKEVQFEEIDFEDSRGQLEEEDLIPSLEIINRAIKDYRYLHDSENSQ